MCQKEECLDLNFGEIIKENGLIPHSVATVKLIGEIVGYSIQDNTTASLFPVAAFENNFQVASLFLSISTN